MLGADLKRVRERRSLSVRELASITGLSHEAVSAIERGARYPSLQTLEALAGALHIHIIIGPDETIVEEE